MAETLEHPEPSDSLQGRFIRGMNMELADASGDPTIVLTACADCGCQVFKAPGEPRTALCVACYDERKKVMAVAASRGFRLGL